jgi:HK97 gp10 family phage protein
VAKELEGVEELTRKLREMGDAVAGKALRNAARAALVPALERARRIVPEGTVVHKTYKGRIVTPGFAARSIRIKSVRTRDRGIGIALLGVKPEAYYALQFVELGTSKQPARPWLSTAFEHTRTEQLESLKAALKRSLIRAAKKK